MKKKRMRDEIEKRGRRTMSESGKRRMGWESDEGRGGAGGGGGNVGG